MVVVIVKSLNCENEKEQSSQNSQMDTSVAQLAMDRCGSNINKKKTS